MTDEITKQEISDALDVLLGAHNRNPERDSKLMETVVATPAEIVFEIRDTPELAVVALGVTEQFLERFGPIDTPDKAAMFCQVVLAVGLSYGIDAGVKLHETRELRRLYGEGPPAA